VIAETRGYTGCCEDEAELSDSAESQFPGLPVIQERLFPWPFSKPVSLLLTSDKRKEYTSTVETRRKLQSKYAAAINRTAPGNA
jgi:hypothetical protein